jgi:rod shape-determining protein MreC
MHDRAVRRRRAVLAALVVASLILLTAYFGESAGGGLHSLQRGALGVLSPIQEGANRALKPARDLFGWFGDTLDAKSERDKLRADRDALRKQLAATQAAVRELGDLKGLQTQNTSGGMGEYQPVQARVYARSPSQWYQTVTINKGSSDGVRPDQPVMNGAGLVGRVKAVTGGSAVVMLLTDPKFGVSAETSLTGEPGTIEPAVGNPGDLLFNLVEHSKNVHKGDQIITAGTQATTGESLFPKSIEIGTVSRVETGEGDLDRVIHVQPAADLRRLDVVQVLTKPTASLTASATP